MLARWTRRSRPLLFCGVEYDGVDVIGSGVEQVMWLCGCVWHAEKKRFHVKGEMG